MGKAGGGIPIDGDDDEPVEDDVRTKRRGGRCRRASPRAPSILPCHIVVVEEETGVVDAIEVEARCQQAEGDSISISDRVKKQRN
jgi:hypothetical protein